MHNAVLQTASGRVLHLLGERYVLVEFTAEGGNIVKATVVFQVTQVRRAIISVSSLEDSGVELVTKERHTGIRCGRWEIPLTRRESLYG